LCASLFGVQSENLHPQGTTHSCNKGISLLQRLGQNITKLGLIVGEGENAGAPRDDRHPSVSLFPPGTSPWADVNDRSAVSRRRGCGRPGYRGPRGDQCHRRRWGDMRIGGLHMPSGPAEALLDKADSQICSSEVCKRNSFRRRFYVTCTRRSDRVRCAP